VVLQLGAFFEKGYKSTKGSPQGLKPVFNFNRSRHD